MYSATKIILFAFLLSFSLVSFAQKPSKGEENAKEIAIKEAKAIEKAEAEAKAKTKERVEAEAKARKLFESQMKGESSQARLSEAAVASVNAKAEAFYSTAINQINVKHVAWIVQSAKKINERNLDELTIKVMANYYGKNAGLNERDIEGLLVLLLRQAYINGKKEYTSYINQIPEIETKKTDIPDSALQNRPVQPDSAYLLNSEKATRKITGSTVEISTLSEKKAMPEESLAGMEHIKEVQALRMQVIAERQQKISQMLSRLVNQVTASQESIIKNLK